MHGAAPGCGAPLRNRNARKHGHFAKQAADERRAIRTLLAHSRKLLRDLRGM
jgi:hypothetical protein